MIKSTEKAEMLKSSIAHLYSKEGRSISYISKLLEINRKTISSKIKEWDLPEPEPKHYLTPSNQKFLNKNRNLIKSRLDNGISVANIADELKISRYSLYKTFICNDAVLKKSHEDYINRKRTKTKNRLDDLKNQSSNKYGFENLENEIWKPILGYNGYYVSNKGRVKHYIKKYDDYILLTPTPNKDNGRMYISLQVNNTRKNLILARVVAHAFVNGHDDKHNTVNHKDGNIQNNNSDNLEWVSQSENNKHAYAVLHRSKVNFKRYKFDKIVYKNKYEFKTVAAFARFINKSETQARRYLDEPDKHEIKLVKNCND